jgi:hypothetical protein
MTDDLSNELQKIYDSEINIRISWFWDGGIDLRLGDEMNGFEAEETVSTTAEIVPWLQEAIAHFYPDSVYAASLSPELRERAARRLFQPPRTGASAICPHCGANHASPGLDELLAFVCPAVAIRSKSSLPRFSNRGGRPDSVEIEFGKPH